MYILALPNIEKGVILKIIACTNTFCTDQYTGNSRNFHYQIVSCFDKGKMLSGPTPR